MNTTLLRLLSAGFMVAAVIRTDPQFIIAAALWTIAAEISALREHKPTPGIQEDQ